MHRSWERQIAAVERPVPRRASLARRRWADDPLFALRPPGTAPRQLLALQRLAGNQAVAALLGGRVPPPVQRHQLDLDQLDGIENDPEVFPVQRVEVDDTSAEYGRVMQERARVERLIRPTIGELASRGLSESREQNKVARHVAKGYQRGLIPAPTAIVEVLSPETLMPADLNPKVAPLADDERWFFWPDSPGNWLRRGSRWGGGYSQGSIGIRDVVAGNPQLLKSVLVHEGTHGYQHGANVEQGASPLEKYKREFRAYWAGSRFVSGDVPGSLAASDDERATVIREYMIGTDAEHENPRYPDIAEWYWDPDTPDQTRAQVDAYRLNSAATWWVTNVHVQKMLDDQFSDAAKLREWGKLTRAEKDSILDGTARLNAAPLKNAIRNPLQPTSRLYAKLA